MNLTSLGFEYPRTLIEIAILWVMFYTVLKTVRGTRAMQVVAFVSILVAAIYTCKLFNLTTVQWLLTSAQLPIFVGLVILYAPEMRRTVSDLAKAPFFWRRSRKQSDPVITEVSQAMIALSKRHIGALVVFERSNSLQGFIDTGIKLDSHISSELLVTIFSPLTPLHDGAVIMRSGQLAAAACLLPLSQREEVDSDLGTRHRAGLGLAEETDAVTVIVSEETGGISIAINGRLTREIDPTRIQHILTNLLKGSAS